MNLFIWQLSATLHCSSSFSVCRSDCRLVHQLHLPKEGFVSGSCWICWSGHCGISYTYPIFHRRTTDWIICCRADFAFFMSLGGTIFRLHQQIILSWCLVGTASTLGAVSTAVGAALLIPILPGNLQVWAALVISCCWSFIQIIARWLEGVAWGGVDFVFHPPRCRNLTRRAGISPDAPPPPPLDSPVCAVISNPRFFWEKGIWCAGSYHCAPDSGASKPAKVLRPFRWA